MFCFELHKSEEHKNQTVVYSGISSTSCSIYKVVTDHSINNQVHSVLEENEQ